MAKTAVGDVALIKRERLPLDRLISVNTNCLGVVMEIDHARENPYCVVFNNGKSSISLSDTEFSVIGSVKAGAMVQARAEDTVSGAPFYLTGVVSFEPLSPQGEEPETPWFEMVPIDGGEKISLPISSIDIKDAIPPREAGIKLLVEKARSFGAVVEKAKDGRYNFYTHPDNVAFGYKLPQPSGEFETRDKAWTACALSLLERKLIASNYYKAAPCPREGAEEPLFEEFPSDKDVFGPGVSR